MPWPLPIHQRDHLRLGRVGPLGALPYHIPNQARATHMYVIGATGQGKSKFLESLLVQDIRAGRGCGLALHRAGLRRKRPRLVPAHWPDGVALHHDGG